MLKRLTVHPVVARLTLREYLPLALSIATWAMIGIAIGHADAVRLLAANTFVQAARALCMLELIPALRRRTGSAREVFLRSRRTAMRIELGGLLATYLLLALTVSFLSWRDMGTAAAMVAIVALGVPARHPGGLFVLMRERAARWRLGAATIAAVGAGVVLLLGFEWWAAAIAFALRDWGGLLATALFGSRLDREDASTDVPMSFGEAAAHTESIARRRLTYRISKSMLGAVLGPFGTIAARTGREVRLDKKLSRFIPRHRGGFIVFTAATMLVGLVFLWVSREPSTLLLGAAFTRVSASGASALLWWSYGNRYVDQEDDEED